MKLSFPLFALSLLLKSPSLRKAQVVGDVEKQGLDLTIDPHPAKEANNLKTTLDTLVKSTYLHISKHNSKNQHVSFLMSFNYWLSFQTEAFDVMMRRSCISCY
jgi:hypothetical protein